jgi:hypothetical protein
VEFPADPRPSPLLHDDWQRMPGISMDGFRAADWQTLEAQRGRYLAAQQASHVLRLLECSRNDPTFGYQVNNYRHCVQAATRALQDGRDEAYVVVALLHDIGFTACPASHGAFAAAMLGPWIPPALHWMLEHHQIFADVHVHEHPDPTLDPAARERWRGHPAFELTAEFVERYDQGTILPGLPEAPLATFVPLVHRLFARPPRPFPPREELA